MILFLKRLNIIIALIIIFIALGLIKFKNNLSYLQTKTFNADAVVVLTGGKGERIIEGYNQIKNSNQKKLFISGVDGTFNAEVVLVNILNFDKEIVECCVEVGYLSKNTYENALETRYWAENNNINSITLITTDLHMQRSLFLFNQITDLEIYSYPITYRESIIPLEKLLSEYIKYLISRVIFIKKYEV